MLCPALPKLQATASLMPGKPPGDICAYSKLRFRWLLQTAIGSPADVVSTRIMVNRAKGYELGMLATIRDMYAKEGLSSFYQGLVCLLLCLLCRRVQLINTSSHLQVVCQTFFASQHSMW